MHMVDFSQVLSAEKDLASFFCPFENNKFQVFLLLSKGQRSTFSVVFRRLTE